MQNLSKRILVIDDEESIHDIVALIFEEYHYEVKGVFYSPTLHVEISNFLPDLILLDFYLAGVDGLKICQALKENPKTIHIPIILLSASIITGEIEHIVDDFIEKPFEITLLVQKVNHFLK